MIGFRMSWLLTLIILISFTFINPSEARRDGKKKLPSALVLGTVYCDTCLQKDFSKTSHFISGALVAVECDGTYSKPRFHKEVKTNQHGEFKVHLPFSVGKHVKKIQGCSVKLISSGERFCSVASTATSSSLHLKSRKAGTHIFSAGFFTFKPLTQPNVCNQKPRIQISQKLNSEKSLIPDPNYPTFPPQSLDPGNFAPIPQIPGLPKLPELPPLPALPGLPFNPPVPNKKATTSSDELSNEKTLGFPFPPNPLQPPSIFPPNPFQPPSIFPPNPFQPPPSVLPPIFPSPPPSIFPPIFPSPSPPPSIFPPIPGLTPTPSPPASPHLFPPIFPIPPGIFPPIPGITPPPLPPPPPPPHLFPPIFPTPPGIFPPIPGFTPPPLPPPPAFPIPLPPFPFQPSPGFPGVPPASSSSLSKKSNP